MSKIIKIDELTELLKKERDGLQLNDIEKKKVENSLDKLNTALANYEEDLTNFKQTIYNMSKGRQTMAFQACIEYALTFIKKKLEVEIAEDEEGEALIDTYYLIRDNILPDLITEITEDVNESE